jgi:hypothetical protein
MKLIMQFVAVGRWRFTVLQEQHQIRSISKIDKETKSLITLDLLPVTDALKEVWKNRQKVKWEKGEYSIVSRDGMITLKEMSGRDKDLIDLTYLRGKTDGS